MSNTPASLIATTVLLAGLSAGVANASGTTTSKRPGYSFFGLGLNVIDYEENTALQVDGGIIDVETDSTVNVTQQSGTFVSFNNDWGFYLTTTSTLGESRANESWEIDETIVRENKVAFEQQRINFVLSRHYKANNYFLFGARYDNTEFKRFAHQLTPSAAGLGLLESSFVPGTESETVLEFSLIGGIERTTLFMTNDPGWRYQAQLIVGIPILSSISNTEINSGEKFTDSFSGFVAQVRTTYGYQFNENLFAGISLDLAISQRNSIDKNVEDATGVNRFPENTLISTFPSVALYWSF